MASDPRDGFETHRAAFRDIALPRRRLDYVVRASAGKPALAPVYYVKLHLARPDADSAPEPVHPKVRVKVVFQRSARVASESSPRDAGHAHAHRRADARLPPHGPRRQPPGQAPRRLNRACCILLSKEMCNSRAVSVSPVFIEVRVAAQLHRLHSKNASQLLWAKARGACSTSFDGRRSIG